MPGADDASKELARTSAEGARGRGRKKSSSGDGEKKPRKPRTPVASLNVRELQEYSTSPARRRTAAAALKTASYSFVQIKELLEYDSVHQVKQDVYRALGEAVDAEDMKATRNLLLLQAENQLQRAIRFASAETLVDEDDNEYQNYEQLAWHHAAREDMRLIGQLAGSFAPLEVHHKNLSEKELKQLVDEAMEELAPGRSTDVVDAEVVDDGES